VIRFFLPVTRGPREEVAGGTASSGSKDPTETRVGLVPFVGTDPRLGIPNYINEITVVRMVVFGAVLLLSLAASSRLRQSRHPQLFPWRGAVSDRMLYLL
jgi:hypothetical protein